MRSMYPAGECVLCHHWMDGHISKTGWLTLPGIFTHLGKYSGNMFFYGCQASFTVWFSNSTWKFIFAFSALNTLMMVSNLASVRLFSSFEICDF